MNLVHIDFRLDVMTGDYKRLDSSMTCVNIALLTMLSTYGIVCQTGL